MAITRPSGMSTRLRAGLAKVTRTALASVVLAGLAQVVRAALALGARIALTLGVRGGLAPAATRRNRSRILLCGRTAGGVTAIAALALATAPALAQGCAMCGTSVGAGDPLGRGLAYSIAFMLAVPNLLVATIGGWIYYVYRRAARAGRTAPESAVGPMRAATHLPASNDEATSARPSIGGAS